MPAFHKLNSVYSQARAPPEEPYTRTYAAKEASPVPKMNFLEFLPRAARGQPEDIPETSPENNKTILIIPIDLPVVVVVALLPLKLHRLVLVLVVLLDGSLVVLRRCQRGHPPRIHQTLLAVHT
jgi:hypothetical protein